MLCTLLLSDALAWSKAPESIRGGWLWPVPGHYHLSRGFNDGSGGNENNVHKALDIDGGTNVVASKTGTIAIIYSGCKNYSGAAAGGKTCKALGCQPSSESFSSDGWCNYGYGNGIVIKHADGLYTHYAHMSSIAAGLYVGKEVAQGTLLGKVGSAGNSTGPHLHFEIALTAYSKNINEVYNSNPCDPAFGIGITNGTAGNARWKTDASGRPYDPDGVIYIRQAYPYTVVGSRDLTFIVKADASDRAAREYPYGASTKKKDFSGGEMVNVKKVVKNSYGNIWYQAADGSFIWDGILDYAEASPEITASKNVDLLLTVVKHETQPMYENRIPFGFWIQPVEHQAGDVVHAIKEMTNSAGSTWYLLDSGKYMWAGVLKKVQPAADQITAIVAPDELAIVVGDTVHIDVDSVPNGVDVSALTYQIENEALMRIDGENNIFCAYVEGATSTNLVISAPNGVTKTVRLQAQTNIESYDVLIDGKPHNEANTVDIYKVGQEVPYQLTYTLSNTYDPGYELAVAPEETAYTLDTSRHVIKFKQPVGPQDTSISTWLPAAGYHKDYGNIIVTDDRQSMYLPSQMQTIGEEAFSGSAARYFFCSDSVNEIHDHAFPSNSCVFLETANLNNYDFKQDNVWFIETGSEYNYLFAEKHEKYIAKRGTHIDEKWGQWSEWSDTSVEADSKTEVETKTVYRYRDTTYTTEYSAWSDWGGYDTIRSTIPDPNLKQEQSARVYIWYWYTCASCGAHSPVYGSNKCPNCGKTVSSDYRIVWMDINTNGSGAYSVTVSGVSRTAYNCPGIGVVYYNPGDNSGKTYTGYRYRTRTSSQKANVGEWTAFSDIEPDHNANREIESKTMYRYRVKNY